jgi:molybdopterin synthase catalytic subunit
MSVSVQHQDFDIAAEMDRLTRSDPDIGAVVSFTGLVRQSTPGGSMSSMELEHYPGMTVRALQEIVARAEERWPLQGVRVIHRVGTLQPGERIVLVLTASRHRQAAFEAAEFLMDYLKTLAPFWKKETSSEGAHWVDARDSDTSAAGRWER